MILLLCNCTASSARFGESWTFEMFLSSFFYLILLPFKQSSNQKIISEYLRAPSYIPAFAAILCVENKQLGLRNMMARACLEIIVISPRCQAKKTVVRLHWFLTFQVLIWFPFFFFHIRFPNKMIWTHGTMLTNSSQVCLSLVKSRPIILIVTDGWSRCSLLVAQVRCWGFEDSPYQLQSVFVSFTL